MLLNVSAGVTPFLAKSMENKEDFNIQDALTVGDLNKKRWYFHKNQHIISFKELLILSEENDKYLKYQSIKIICIKYMANLINDVDCAFRDLIRDIMVNERDCEIVNYLLQTLRHLFMEKLEIKAYEEALAQSPTSQTEIAENGECIAPRKGTGPSNGALESLFKERFIAYGDRCDQRKNVEELRVFFISDEKIRNRLLAFLESNDLIYNALFLIWIFSFTKKTFDFLTPACLIKTLRANINKETKEKVLRITSLIFLNFQKHEISISLKNSHLMFNIIKIMKMKKSTDQEFLHDRDVLYNNTMNTIKKFTSVDNYLKELYSGHLEASTYHVEENFWITNAVRLQSNKHKIVKAIDIYLKRDNRENVIIALKDLYMFQQVDTSVGVLIRNCGARNRLMELCDSRDGEIQFFASRAFLSILKEEIF